MTEVMEETGLEEAETYVTRRQNTVAQYIEIQPITDLCLEMERCRGARVYKRWREQGCLNLVGEWEAVTRAVEAEEEEEG